MDAQRRFRDPVNGFLHLSGLVFSLAGAYVLWGHTHGDWSAMVYMAGMIGCYVGSSLHHLVPGSPQLEQRLLKWDHAAIYPYIAGSYTPVCVHLLPGAGGWSMLAAVWTLALVGIGYKLGFAPDQASVDDPPPLPDTLLYIAMGWLAAFQLQPLVAHAVPGSIPLAVAGGMAYSVGGLILARKWLDFWPGRFGHHEIWHLLVMVGSAFMYAFVWANVA